MNIMINYGQWMQAVCVPLIFVMVGMLAKRIGKRDGDDTPRRNDWAVSTSIVLMTISHISADLFELEENGKNNTRTILCLFLGFFLFCLSLDHDRSNSWKRDKLTGANTKEKSLFIGIILPNFISVILFIIYQLLKN